MTGACVFCTGAGPGVLTNEHVIPRWLQGHLQLPADDQLFQGIADSATGQLVEKPRVHSTSAFVQGRVCHDCNEGWMSRLETAAKPVLIPLIDGDQQIAAISSADAAVVGKWAAKTAYMHNYAAPSTDRIQLSHVKALCGDTGAALPGVNVFGMQGANQKPSSYFRTGAWLQAGTPQVTASGDTPPDAYKIGLQFGALHLLIAFWPNPTSRPLLVKSTHIRVWPPSSEPDAMIEMDIAYGSGPVDRLAGFSNSLGIWHPQAGRLTIR